MADFVGLLKKTIESQSQMTPQLRQRIYDRARATVERKLTESQAPASIVERQREILERAVDEVEAFYLERDENLPAQEPEQQLSDVPVAHDEPSLVAKTIETQTEVPVIEAVASSLPAGSATPDLSAPPPFEEAFEREEAQPSARAEGASQSTVPLVASPPPSFSPPSGDDSPRTLLPHAVPDSIATPEAIGTFAAPLSHVKPEIPTLASMLKNEEGAALPHTAADELPPLDLPFLGAESDEENRGAALKALPREQISHMASAREKEEPEKDSVFLSFSAAAEDMPASESAREMVESTAKPSSSSPFEDYLPHWSVEKKIEPTPPPAHPDTPDLPPFSSSFSLSLPEREIPDIRAESEIDRARREIEALRTGTDAQANPRRDKLDEQPFSPLDLPPLPVELSSQTPRTDEGRATEDVASNEADFNNDLVSEIFVQAVKREQKQSNKKRRLAAFVIGAVVLAVFAVMGGVLILMNEYQIGELVGQGSGQVTTSPTAEIAQGNGSQAGTVGMEETTTNSQKITRRLLPNGQEADPGPAMDNATPGEGSSQASATLPQIDSSARAVFYEAPTDTLSATANDGRVDWSLRRTTASGTSGEEELAIVGDVKIPALDMTLRLTLRRNHDAAVPADYLTEIVFALPDDFEGEAIDEIGPVLFKASEQSTGQELAGTVTAKVQDNLFLMAARAPGPILDRNLALMRQLPWLKLNVLYKNGRVGEFSIAKGEGGQRIFQQVIDEWSRHMTGELSSAPVTTLGTASPADEAIPVDQDPAFAPLSSDEDLPGDEDLEGEEDFAVAP